MTRLALLIAALMLAAMLMIWNEVPRPYQKPAPLTSKERAACARVRPDRDSTLVVGERLVFWKLPKGMRICARRG
jgi:hypothetical protein